MSVFDCCAVMFLSSYILPLFVCLQTVGLYQDRQQDAAFVMATNINEQGNITHSLVGA